MSFLGSPVADEIDNRSDDDIAYAAAIDGSFGEDSDRLASDEKEIDAIEASMVEQFETAESIRLYGVDEPAFILLKNSQLLSGTALESLGLEALTNGVDGKSVADIAYESLMTNVKEKAAAWSAKILSFVKSATSKMVAVVKAIVAKVTVAAKAVGEQTWDAAKAASETVKAHPYKTIMTALGAVATVVGVIMYVNTSLPVGTVTNGALDHFLTKLNVMIKSIKFPGMKIYTKTLVDGKLVMAQVETAEQLARSTDKLSALGWTKNTLSAIIAQATKYGNTIIDGVSKFWNTFGKPVERVASKIFFLPKDIGKYVKEKTDSRMLEWATTTVISSVYYKFLYRLVGTIYSLIRSVVVGTMQMIRDTFSAIALAL